MMSDKTGPEQARADLKEFQTWLALELAGRMGCPVRAAEEAVSAVTEAWLVDIHRSRPVTNPHDRFCIHTPWRKAEEG